MVEEGDLDDKLEEKATNEVVDDVKKVAMEGIDKEKKQVAMKVANTNCLDDLIDAAILLPSFFWTAASASKGDVTPKPAVLVCTQQSTICTLRARPPSSSRRAQITFEAIHFIMMTFNLHCHYHDVDDQHHHHHDHHSSG